METRRARGFFSDERGRDDRPNLRPPGRETARVLRAATERENGARPLLALELLTKSSAQDNGDATYDLAVCYENGLGCAKDLAKARELFRKADLLGHPGAKARLKELGA